MVRSYIVASADIAGSVQRMADQLKRMGLDYFHQRLEHYLVFVRSLLIRRRFNITDDGLHYK